jgi:hypothetical protein
MSSVSAGLTTAAALLIFFARPHAETQTPSLDDLLSRAGAYVTRYTEIFSNVVTEEEYTQRSSGRAGWL